MKKGRNMVDFIKSLARFSLLCFWTSANPEKKNIFSKQISLLLLYGYDSIKHRLRTPLAGGLRSQKGLRPFNPLQRIDSIKHGPALNK